MANKRFSDLPEATSSTVGDVLPIDGLTTRKITIENLMIQILTASQTQQIKTTAGDVTVAAADGLIAINKTVGGSTTVSLPASSAKIGPVKIVDWKGDAGTNNITIAVTGSDKLNGNLTSWIIGADGGSVVLTPLSNGTGYAV